MAQKSRELKEQGIDVISLSLGEPDFNTPDDIKEAAKKAIDDNFSFYPPVPGYADLREAISRKVQGGERTRLFPGTDNCFGRREAYPDQYHPVGCRSR
ncbi:MAG: aminotransferase class I/II-fold pyridoxal phosphate-dependent enzyme [Marinilabiliales bacterium]|nr:aminotransferase class I/II-fold pyridoxal phosphate-dependent enzyme [Marinilabiliales bacterium]